MEMRNDLGLVGTIEDDDECEANVSQEDSDDEQISAKKKKKKSASFKKDTFYDGILSHNDDSIDDDEMASSRLFAGRNISSAAATGSQQSSLDEKIARMRKLKHKAAAADHDINYDSDGDDDAMDVDRHSDEDESSSSEHQLQQDVVREKMRVKKAKKKTKCDKLSANAPDAEEEKITYADEVTSFDKPQQFSEFDLRRPLQRALTAMQYNRPTSIQSATIPLALKGRDICACSATGTGKTAAFMVPTLERLLYCDTKSQPTTRVLVLAPTRELAIQIYEESRRLAQFTNITVCLSAGGLDIKSQEAALRQLPDIVIATPGRLIDHLRNAPSFHLNNVEVLILDEADRMLDEFFLEQMKEVVRLCSQCRQTMLFSATMTENVKELATVSLSNPVKVFVNENKDIAFNLQQEFIRVRPHMEADREAIVAALIKRTFREQTIVFIQTKKEAHRMHIVLGLLGVRVGELHGSLSQAQRLDALRKFKDGEIAVLIATDLAARGLDIEHVKTVINLTMPCNIERYIHRVGRTARAGKSGRSVSLSGESERRLLHEICRRSAKAGRPVLCRTVSQKIIEKYRERIRRLEDDIGAIEDAEREEKELRVTELKANKAQNMLEHRDEILARPKRTWFQTHAERMQDIAGQQLSQFSSGGGKQSRKQKAGKESSRVQTADERMERELQKAALVAARSSKRQLKDKRIRAFDDDRSVSDVKRTKKDKVQPRSAKKKKKNSFDRELTSTSRKALRHYKSPANAEQKKSTMKNNFTMKNRFQTSTKKGKSSMKTGHHKRKARRQ